MSSFADLGKSALALCAAAVFYTGTADAATTHSAADGVLTIDVPSGEEENFNLGWVNDVTPAITNIVKRGAGKMLSPNNISTYTGDFDIEEGIWCCTNSGSGGYRMGAQSGTVHVRDGASIEYAGSYVNPGDLSGKTVHLYGAAAANAKEGAKIFMSQSVQMGDPGLGKNVRVVLHDDAAFYSRNRLKLTGTFDLGGKVLTLKNNSHDIGGVVTNGGSVVLANNSTWMTQSAAIDFAADCAATSFVKIGSGCTFNIKDKRIYAHGWTIKNEGGAITCNSQRQPTSTSIGIWEGPIEFTGSAYAANYGASAGAWGISNTVFNVEGPISGSGSLIVGPGWLNLHDAVNTYSGAVTVRGKGTKRTAGNNENVVPPGAGGIGVWNGASVFTNASSITLKDSARVEFMDDIAASVGALRFVGDTSTFTNGDPGDDTQSIKGGSAETRSTIAGLEKTGTNTLVVGTPAHFTGTATISEGILKIPYRSTRGTPGLVESHATPKKVDTWIDIQYIYEPTPAYWWIFTPWNSNNASHCDVTEKGICAVGAQRAYKGMINTNTPGWDDGYVDTLPSDKKSGRNAWWYSGYVWNNTDAPATYTVWFGGNGATGSAIWFGEDHSACIQLKVGRDNTQHGKPVADAQEFTLQPGATKIDIVVVSEQLFWCQSVPSTGERYGLVYAPTSVCTAEHLNKLIVDYYDSASTASTNALSAALCQFSEFKDEGGVGELFTADIYGDGDGARKTTLLPVFDDLRFENGTTLDLDGNLDFCVKDLVGSPTVVNAVKMTVTNNWTVLAADFPKADATVRRPMTVAGKLVFADGATFSVDDENAIERNQSGIVVATATDGIVGCPKQAAGGSKRWKLFVSGNDLYLRSGSGLLLFLR